MTVNPDPNAFPTPGSEPVDQPSESAEVEQSQTVDPTQPDETPVDPEVHEYRDVAEGVQARSRTDEEREEEGTADSVDQSPQDESHDHNESA